MKYRNIHVQTLFDVLEDDTLSIEERNERAITAINAIVVLKPEYEAFKRNNPEQVFDRYDNVSLDLRGGARGYTPLTIAVSKGYTEIVTALLHANADTNKAGGRPLFYATHPQMVSILLESNANPNDADIEGCTAFQNAALRGKTDLVIAFLSSNKVDPNRENWRTRDTALIYAAQNGHAATVIALLNGGAAPNHIGRYRETALSKAAKGGHTEIVTLLLNENADPNNANGYQNTVLMMAAERGHTEIVTLLLNAKAEPNRADKFHDTALILAARNGHIDIVKALLDAGADIDPLNRSDKSALDYAINNDHFSIVLFLLQRNAKVSDLKKLHQFLSSQDQNDPRLIECLQILSMRANNANTEELTPEQENEAIYLRKLIILHSSYKSLLAYLADEDSRTFFPLDIMGLIFEYEGEKFFKPGPHVPAIRLFEPATVDPHLEALKQGVLENAKRAGPGFFNKTILAIDSALGLGQRQDTTLVDLPQSSSSLGMNQLNG